MLIRGAMLEAIAAGRVSLAFRRWRRPTVKAGGTLLTAVGVLAVDAVDIVDDAAVSDGDAQAAGYADRQALLADLAGRSGDLYRITLRLAGPDPRVALREDDAVGEAAAIEICRRLARLDAAGRHGPWTAAVLGLVAAHPGVRAVDLAARLGRDTASFKADVRKLKALGLTESLDVGYRLSSRGRAFRAWPGPVS